MGWWPSSPFVAIAVTAAALAVIVTVQSVAADSDDFLRVDPVYLQNMFYFHPGETHVMKAWVVNTGTYKDSYELTVDVDGPPRWVVVLDLYRADDVQPGEKVAFNLSITAALDAQEGDHIFVNVTARSLMSNKTDSLNFISFVIISRGVRISCDNLTREMGSGETIGFILNVTNTGDVNDSYKIEWITYPGDAPWSAEASARTFDLERRKSTSILFNVTSPDDRAEDGSVWVSVTSTADKRATDSLVLHCHVKVRWSASVQPANGTILVRPGVAERFELNLTQLTNDRRDRNWSVGLLITDPTWDVEATPSDFVMAGTSAKIINLTILAPSRSSPWESAALSVVLRCEQVPTEPLEALFALQVVEVHKLDLLSYAPQVSLWPGDSADVGFDIMNSGNVAEIVQVSIGPTGGLTYSTSIGPIEGPWFQLLPWEQVRISIHITAPEDSSGIVFPIVNVSSVHTNTLTVHLLVTVLSYDEEPEMLRMTRGSNDTVLVDPRNETVGIDLIIENLMGEELEASFRTCVSNPRCSAMIMEDPVFIPANGRGLRIHLNVEADAPYGDFVLLIEADYGPVDPLTINCSVVGPDLKLSGVDVPKRVFEGELANVSMTIANVGRGWSSPTILTVTDTWGKPVANPLHIPAIGPGKSINRSIGMLPYSGRYDYALSVNPNGTMREDGNASNSQTFELRPISRIDAGASSRVRIWVGAIILMLLVLAIMALRMMSRRKSAS
jgi:hypothetical protein